MTIIKLVQSAGATCHWSAKVTSSENIECSGGGGKLAWPIGTERNIRWLNSKKVGRIGAFWNSGICEICKQGVRMLNLVRTDLWKTIVLPFVQLWIFSFANRKILPEMIKTRISEAPFANQPGKHMIPFAIAEWSLLFFCNYNGLSSVGLHSLP